jgi:hypothetical protein
MLYLCGLNGEVAGCVLEIGPQGVTIGRDPQKCGFVLPRREVSRVHASIMPISNFTGMIVQDLNSTNGTFALTGQAKRAPASWVQIPPGRQVQLYSRDRFRLGSSGAEFEIRELSDVGWGMLGAQQDAVRANQRTIAMPLAGRGMVPADPLPMSGYMRPRANADLVNRNQKRCPVCNSPSLAAAKRGYSAGWGFAGLVFLGPLGLFAGAIGKDDILVHCMNCGNEWKP